jgi:exonuclease III
MNYDPCSFRLTHVNIRGFRANRQNLLNYLAEENFTDVITINETKLGVSTDVLMLPNYEIAARREPTMNGGRHGSMILVKNTIKEACEISDMREQFIEEVVGVKVKTSNNYTFNIITYYNPPGKLVNERILATPPRCS